MKKIAFLVLTGTLALQGCMTTQSPAERLAAQQQAFQLQNQAAQAQMELVQAQAKAAFLQQQASDASKQAGLSYNSQVASIAGTQAQGDSILGTLGTKFIAEAIKGSLGAQ